MSRVPITEYAAKKLYLGDAYPGISLTAATTTKDISPLTTEQSYVVKVDTGVKQRGKNGLLKVGVSKDDIMISACEFFARGYARCLVEPLIPHAEDTEHYLSIELTRAGIQLLSSDKGGVAIEDHFEHIVRTLLPYQATKATLPDLALGTGQLQTILDMMERYHLSFLEINPYIVKNSKTSILDLAVEIDSTKTDQLPAWCSPHILDTGGQTPEEAAVTIQNNNSPASLTLRVLEPQGSILTLLSGGGASLVAMDSLVAAGLSPDIINYSEYSGAPTRDETRAYVSTLLGLLLQSSQSKKVILIAGGVSNFTDIKDTLTGIIDACTERLNELKAENVAICVRRGGPRAEVALGLMRDFIASSGLRGEVHGPELSLGSVGTKVKTYLV